MKLKNLILLLSLAVAATAAAIPAKRGYKKLIALTDGTHVEAELRGDEHLSYWLADDGTCYVQHGSTDTYEAADMRSLRQLANQRRMAANVHRIERLRRVRRSKIGGDHDPYVGQKKGLVILVNFKNMKFSTAHSRKFFDRMMNDRNLSSNLQFRNLGFQGSVKDYFFDQSDGRFELDFDIVGPYTLSNDYAYYGSNSGTERDQRVGHMILEAVKMADSEVDFSVYDWDGDGEVEQIYVMYAGMGEAAGGTSETVWPHEHQLSASSYGKRYTTDDGIVVNTYACGPENGIFYNGNRRITRVDGIGTICHEFSHCLGLPDVYDTEGHNYGMGSWDLMDNGSYNGQSLLPPNYSAYEKMYAGWITPIELKEPTTVRGMQPQGKSYGQTFIIYNDKHPDEYFLLENRQQSGNIWDSALAGSGLMIQYVDFSERIWYNNKVNAYVNYSDEYGVEYADWDNDHQRCTIFHADGKATMADERGDLYPFGDNNSLTDNSSPAAVIYHDGQFMGKPITNIVQNADGTISFDFMGGSGEHVIDGIQNVSANQMLLQDEMTRVFDLQGRLIYAAPASSFNLWDVPVHGVIFVNQGGQVRKMIR